jgi:hypothetical protein
MCCPACKDDTQLDITANVNVRLRVNGTDADESEDGDHEWNDESACSCGSCGWSGTVAEAEAAYEEECETCELPTDVCACADAADYDEANPLGTD